MENIAKYKQISDNYKNSITRGFSRQIVIDAKQAPKTVGIWGRLTRYLSSLRKTDQQLKEAYKAAIVNFKEAIAQKYSEQARDQAYKIVDAVVTNNRSLRARDVNTAIDAADQAQVVHDEKEQNEANDRKNISEQMKYLLGDKLTRAYCACLARPAIKNIAPGVSLSPDENTALLVCTGAVDAIGDHGDTVELKTLNHGIQYLNENPDSPHIVKPLIFGMQSALAKIDESKKNDNQSEEFICVAKKIKKRDNVEESLSKNQTLRVEEYMVMEIYETDTDKKFTDDRKDPKKIIQKFKTSSGRVVNIPQDDGTVKRFLIVKPGTVFASTTSTIDVREYEQGVSDFLRTPEDKSKGAIIRDLTERESTEINS